MECYKVLEAEASVSTPLGQVLSSTEPRDSGPKPYTRMVLRSPCSTVPHQVRRATPIGKLPLLFWPRSRSFVNASRASRYRWRYVGGIYIFAAAESLLLEIRRPQSAQIRDAERSLGSPRSRVRVHLAVHFPCPATHTHGAHAA